jgi:hypothetical protein
MRHQRSLQRVADDGNQRHDGAVSMTPAEAKSELQLACWRFDLGLQPSEELVGLAVDALVAGLDGPALVELAGSEPGDPRTARDVFADVVLEQGLDRADEQTALWHLVTHTAQQIVRGTLDPITGARWIWREASHRAEPEGDLRIFIGLASEADDHPNDREELGRAVAQESAALLARGKPRQWLRLQADPVRALSISTTRGQAPVGPDELALTDALASRVAGWSQAWTHILDGGGFSSTTDAETFVENGRVLAEALQDWLGSRWNVEYYPEPIRPPGLRLRRS